MLGGIAFNSARSPVMSRLGMVSTTQPLASAVGASILAKGGNAMDAAVAAAAVQNLTEPCSTGIGGDGFLLYYDARAKEVRGLNGSGRCPMGLTIPQLRARGYSGSNLPDFDVNTVTVPGVAALWEDSLRIFGTMTLAEVLQPAITMCTDGVPIEPITAHFWAEDAPKLLQWGPTSELLVDGTRAPGAGEMWVNPGLGRTFQRLAELGKKGFYEGPIAEAIAAAVQAHGGALTAADLQGHATQEVTPISCEYRGYRLHEIPPNSQGIVVLLALRILSHFDISAIPHNSPRHLHLVTEALRLAFADAARYVCDTDAPDSGVRPELYQHLLSDEYIKERVAAINLDRANPNVSHGLVPATDTVYISVVDRWGNAASFINSNYNGFGTGLVPQGWGFSLQNRGKGFVLDEAHPNALRPGKRPLHTLLPGLITKDGELAYCFGCVGAYMQPQGQVQIALNLIDYAMGPQAALDAPRLCVVPGEPEPEVQLEEGLNPDALAELRDMGHRATGPHGAYRKAFGRGQVIQRLPSGVLVGASDPRGDGCAIPVAF